MMSFDSSHPEHISGIVEKVTFHDTENGFCVLQVQQKKEFFTVVGNILSIKEGDFIKASGDWFKDPKYGLQFKSQFLETVVPTTLEGIEKYLGSGLIQGIGPAYAKKLIDAFGKDVFRIIEEEPHKLNNIPGIGSSKAEKIIKGWADQKSVRDIMIFLSVNDVSSAKAVRIYKTYGAEAIKIISENPYRLARDIRGIGFISADKIAEKVGIEKTSMVRAQAGIHYALTTAMEGGNCGLPIDRLMNLSQELLDVPFDLVQKGLELELEKREVVQVILDEEECVFLSRLYYYEKKIAEQLLKLQSYQLPWPEIDICAAIQWVEEKTNLKLSPSQKKAVDKALTSKVMIITGGPGVGKTTLVNSILKILQEHKLEILLCAPTGRAAKRLSESTGYTAKTIHRILEANASQGGFTRNESFPLECDVVVVDEMSMVDVPLMHALLKAVPPKAALFLIGDVDQLPSVGPGQVLADLIDSKAIATIRLTEIFRQLENSGIVTAAHEINRGIIPNLTNAKSDFCFIRAEDFTEIIAILSGLIKAKASNPFSQIQILCPMSKGIIGTKNMNIEVQKIFNPPTSNSIQHFGRSYSVGDKVMQIENNYDKEVYNGDIGFIHSINPEESEITITFETKDVVYDFGELDEIVLAYATTIHKSQGSEYPVVIIILTMQHYYMLKRNLIYTAITRGKQLVVVVGHETAFKMAITQNNEQKRISSLKSWLK